MLICLLSALFNKNNFQKLKGFITLEVERIAIKLKQKEDPKLDLLSLKFFEPIKGIIFTDLFPVY